MNPAIRKQARIAAAMIHQKVRQKDLAKRLKKDPAVISKAITRDMYPRVRAQIEEVLGV